MSILSIAMIRWSSLETPSLLSFIGILNLFILLLIVVKSGMEGTFPWACPCAILSVRLFGRWKYTLAYPGRREM
jgi:hypothetical protein